MKKKLHPQFRTSRSRPARRRLRPTFDHFRLRRPQQPRTSSGLETGLSGHKESSPGFFCSLYSLEITKGSRRIIWSNHLSGHCGPGFKFRCSFPTSCPILIQVPVGFRGRGIRSLQLHDHRGHGFRWLCPCFAHRTLIGHIPDRARGDEMMSSGSLCDPYGSQVSQLNRHTNPLLINSRASAASHS